MVNFTIVLHKKRKKRFTRKNKTGRKIRYFLPVILIVASSVAASFFVGDTQVKTEKEYEADGIEVFKKTDDYSVYYMPIVVNEFYSYKQGQSLENETLVKLAVWSIILNEDTSEYEAFEGKLVIDAQEVAARVKTLFSKKVSFENTSAKGENYKIEYDKATDNYIVPVLGFSPEYSGVLESVTVQNGKTVLRVGCLKSENFKQDSSGNTVLPEAEKTVVIVLPRQNGELYIDEISEE